MPNPKFVIGIAAAVLAATPSRSEAGSSSTGAVSIDTLGAESLQSLPYECECEFYRGPIEGATTVFATRSHQTVAFAKIDGQTLTLRRGGTAEHSSCLERVRQRERWIGGTASVALDYRVTRSGEEACWFRGKMRVTVGGRTAETAVTGACGC
jgi:hypothetical protein